MASGTLARQTDVIDTGPRTRWAIASPACARKSVPTRRASTWSPRRTRRARRRRLALLTVGGGSVTDAAKWSAYAWATTSRRPSSSTIPRLDHARRRTERPPTKPPGVRFDRRADHAVGRRVHLVRRLHRYARHVKESYGTALMMPSRGDPRPGGHRAHAGVAVPVDRHPRRGSRGRGSLLDQSARRSPTAPRCTRCGCCRAGCAR
jgi:hypothetical protein